MNQRTEPRKPEETPFSYKSWRNGLESEYGRFELGWPPKKNGDYAFLLHVLKSLKGKGKAAIILPHGVLFRRHAEEDIRRELLKRGLIKGVIGLPPNLFYGTGIPACIVVLDKENAAGRVGVFMIDASRGFAKDGPKNRLRSQDVHKIVDVFNKQTEVERYSRMVPLAEITNKANGYNLNIPRYIDSSKPEDIQDLDAHLHGGIPNRDIDALSPYWGTFPSLRKALFKRNRAGYSDLRVSTSEVQLAILDSEEFKKFAASVTRRVSRWFAAHRHALATIDENTNPGELIQLLGDDLLARFRKVPLLDEYDVYEQLLSYWHETMHDDVFMIMSEGWIGAANPRKALEDEYRKLKETPDLMIGSGRKADKFKTDLIPPSLIVAHYFSEEKAELDSLEAKVEAASRAAEEYTEEHAVEEGLLWHAVKDEKVNKTSVSARLKEAKSEDADGDEVAALEEAAELFAAASIAKKEAADAKTALDLAALNKYDELTELEIANLVIDFKWKATISSQICRLLTELVQTIVVRLSQLDERYAETLASLDAKFAESHEKVTQHLRNMCDKS